VNVALYVTATWLLPLMTELAKNLIPIFFFFPPPFFSAQWRKYWPGRRTIQPSSCRKCKNKFLGELSQVAGHEGVHIARSEISGIVADEGRLIEF